MPPVSRRQPWQDAYGRCGKRLEKRTASIGWGHCKPVRHRQELTPSRFDEMTPNMNRRTFLQSSLALSIASRLSAATPEAGFESASEVLSNATASKQVQSAALYVQQGKEQFAQSFGNAPTVDSMFLLASITKPICVTAVMSLYDEGAFALDDRVQKFIPEFTGTGRDQVTIRHLLTHTCGLPDQLPQNSQLRSQHAPLSAFVQGAIRTPLLFKAGEKYSYSSMGILLATEIAQRITHKQISDLVQDRLFDRLGMKHSALGLGRFTYDDMIPCQIEAAAPESGAGDPATKSWDWNSRYWRELGVPWGGAHGSARDVGTFLHEFLHPTGRALKPATARQMVINQNKQGIRPRGLAFDVGKRAGSRGCSEQTFGHTGSTGTLCWADPATDVICVVLTTLPGRAVDPHPRRLASDRVADSFEN